MDHYDNVEWTLYRKDLLHKKIKEEMEDHLLECDHCMNIFLSIIDEELEDTPKVSKDFTDNVMMKINTKVKTNKKKNIYNEVLVYYMAVASVAIFLTGSGFFHTIANRTPEFGAKLIASKKEVRVDSVYNFSQNITDATASFVNNFNLKEKENK